MAPVSRDTQTAETFARSSEPPAPAEGRVSRRLGENLGLPPSWAHGLEAEGGEGDSATRILNDPFEENTVNLCCL